MQNTYVDIMIQSLRKKVKVLEDIKQLNEKQKALLENDRSDADEFDKTVEDKSARIEQLEQLDEGFDQLFARVRSDLNMDREAYKDKIQTMQNYIRQITDLSMEIQAQEARNKEFMTRKFVSIRERARTVRTSSKAANRYYKNMMQLNYVDPQFLDKKSR